MARKKGKSVKSGKAVIARKAVKAAKQQMKVAKRGTRMTPRAY